MKILSGSFRFIPVRKGRRIACHGIKKWKNCSL